MMYRCKLILLIILLGSLFIIDGCNTTPILKPQHGLAVDQIRGELEEGVATDKKLQHPSASLPKVVTTALLPTSTMHIPHSYYGVNERHFNVSANKTPARAFFMGLVDGTRYNMIVNSNVTGFITLDLKHVTIDEVLEAVRDTYGYEYQKKSYGYQILPRKLVTKIFNINYLNVKRTGKSLVEVTSGQISEQINGYSSGTSTGTTPISASQTIPSGSSVNTRSEANFWSELDKTLKQMVSNKNGRSVATNPNAGLVIVHAYPNEVRAIGRFLDRIQTNMNRQVILEAKILEVQLNDEFQAGIDWNMFGKVAEGDGGVGDTAFEDFRDTDPELTDFNSLFALRINGDFGVFMKLLQTQGNIQILSSPHISTVNNQKAIIKVGQDEFFVTGISSTTSVSSGINNSYYPTENINLTPFFSGITLDVTPQISSRGEIILHIHPTISKVQDQEKTIILGNGGVSTNQNVFVLPLAQSTIRESDTIVRAKDGQVIVIGGLMQNDMREEVAGVPLFSRIPLIGPWFRRTKQTSGKVELVILLKPILAKNKAWIDSMQQDDKTMFNMRRGFHIGGLSEVFGNEGEMTDTSRELLY